MKKVSTAAVTQSRNFSVQQKLTIGLDLGDRRSWYCVLDEAGKVQVEMREALFLHHFMAFLANCSYREGRRPPVNRGGTKYRNRSGRLASELETRTAVRQGSLTNRLPPC
jgi:hypothetical protein